MEELLHLGQPDGVGNLRLEDLGNRLQGRPVVEIDRLDHLAFASHVVGVN